MRFELKLQSGCAFDLDLVGLLVGLSDFFYRARLEIEARLTFSDVNFGLTIVKMAGFSDACDL